MRRGREGKSVEKAGDPIPSYTLLGEAGRPRKGPASWEFSRPCSWVRLGKGMPAKSEIPDS